MRTPRRLRPPPRAPLRAPIAVWLAVALGALTGTAGPAVADGRPAPAAELAAGRLLVASRDLADPNFSQTVVLLLKHGPEGALGLIVNRRTELPLATLLPELEGIEGRRDPVWEGGPVLRTAFLFLARGIRSAEPPPGLERVLGGIFFGTSAEHLGRLFGGGLAETDLRVYAGHAGWAPGQLEREIRFGGWAVLPATEEIVFSPTPERLWLELSLAGEDRVAAWSRHRGPAAQAERTETTGGSWRAASVQLSPPSAEP